MLIDILNDILGSMGRSWRKCGLVKFGEEYELPTCDTPRPPKRPTRSYTPTRRTSKRKSRKPSRYPII